MHLAFLPDRVLLKILFTSITSQLVVNNLYKLNDTYGIAIGALLVISLTMMVIKRYRTNYQSYFKAVFFKRNVISVRLFLLFFSKALVDKYLLKTNWPGEKSLGQNGIYILYGIVTAMLVLMIINVFAVAKLYLSEAKTKMAAN